MALLARSLGGSVTLVASNTPVTLPATMAWENVTSELSGLTGPQYTLLEAQRLTGAFEIQWEGPAKYSTGALTALDMKQTLAASKAYTDSQVAWGLPTNTANAYLRRNSANDAWEEALPEDILATAAADIDVGGQKIVNLGDPTPGTAEAATAAYADSIGVNSLLLGVPVYLTSSYTVGLSQPNSLPDALLAAYVAGGSVAGAGVRGLVSATFANVGDETGTGVGQAALGSASHPYPYTYFPGQHDIHTILLKVDGSNAEAQDILTTVPLADKAQAIECYISYRSDLPADQKWRLWFYYLRASDGAHISVTPDITLANASLYIPVVDTLAALPVGYHLGMAKASVGVVGVTFGVLGDITSTNTSALAGSTGRVADAGHRHPHGTQTVDTLHARAVAGVSHGFLDKTDKTKIDNLPASTLFIADGVLKRDASNTGWEMKTPHQLGNTVQTTYDEISVDTSTTAVAPVYDVLMTRSITLEAGTKLRAHFTAGASNDHNNGHVHFRLLIDGTPYKGGGMVSPVAGAECTVAFTLQKTGLAAGAHTVTIEWSVSGYTGSICPVSKPFEEHAELWMEELRT